MTTVEIRGIRATVDGPDLWAAEQRVGRARLREAIQAAVGAVLHEVAVPSPRSLADRVRELHTAGLCDSLIATELHVLKHHAANVRRSLGLKPNRCHRSGGRRSA